MAWESWLYVSETVYQEAFPHPQSSKIILGDAELLTGSQTLHPVVEQEPALSTS